MVFERMGFNANNRAFVLGVNFNPPTVVGCFSAIESGSKKNSEVCAESYLYKCVKEDNLSIVKQNVIYILSVCVVILVFLGF